MPIPPEAVRAAIDADMARKVWVDRCTKGHRIEGIYKIRGHTIRYLSAIRPNRVPARAFYVDEDTSTEPRGCQCGPDTGERRASQKGPPRREPLPGQQQVATGHTWVNPD